MPTPQPAVLRADASHALFMVLDCADAARAAAVLASTPSLGVEVGSLDEGAGMRLAAGIGGDLWDRISRGPRPHGLRPFRRVDAAGGVAPATGGDAFLHVSSERQDLNFELATRIMAALAGTASVREEVHGFRYLDSRDLTGFIDGTENPQGDDRAAAAIIGDEDLPFAGGSYVAVQRYVHDLASWRRLAVAEQERVVGRTKAESTELPDKPATAHVSRVVIEEEGRELEIVRHSYPYGTQTEAGLYFVAYGRSLHPFEAMLERMMGASGDGASDRLMTMTRAVSGATFFVPSLEVLTSLGRG